MKRGWCPGLYRPMPTGDGWLVRLRPPRGRIDAAQLTKLADAVQAFGNGMVELTGQARLQIRGLSAATMPGFTAAMLAAGLADSDPDREYRRRVIALPDGDAALAAHLEAALVESDIVFADKFDVVVGVDDEAPADIMVHRGLLWLAGATLAAPVQDPILAILCIAKRLTGARVRDIGAEELYRAAGLHPIAPIPAHNGPTIGPQGRGFYLGVLFGSLDPASLYGLARLGAHGDGIWQLTRSRALHLQLVDHAPALASAAATCGFIVSADDPRVRISACIGAPGCASAIGDARGDALRRVTSLPAGARLHVAGCAKACGQPKHARLILCGRAA